MEILNNNSAVLQLEETLLILEESLQHNVFYNSIEKRYIKRLKQFYSPYFDIEHSETGSYYFATLQCIKLFYLDAERPYRIPLSDKFITSMHHLFEINIHTLDARNNQSGMTEQLLFLSEIWELHDTLDIADLLVNTLIKMRSNLIYTYEGTLKS
ncbi:MAG: hypothetical protein R8G33_10065 [Gammaproteobacteria bacterium]|nr:hypothetical protein [Gammaproteobacteria bacterium]